MSLPTILKRIVESTLRRVERRRTLHLPERPTDIGSPRIGRFRDALRRQTPSLPLHFLCEIKRASPSKGMLRPEFQPDLLAHDYAAHGADAISVLTEPEFFQGAHEHLAMARLASNRPCLLKDFVLDPFQIEEAAAYGADAVLLILSLLDEEQFVDLLSCTRQRGLDALVEIHTEDELGVALAADADLVGINNRDLETFEVDPGVTARLRPLVSHGVVVVSESGISTAEDVRLFSDLGIDALLIGEHFMRAEKPGHALDEMKRAARRAVEAPS